MIEVKNLTKSFKSGESTLVVLKGLDLSVPEGQFLSITGRSGSGKSTLLYQLGLLDHPDSGQITIDGVDVEYDAYLELLGIFIADGCLTKENMITIAGEKERKKIK